jgi:spermidine synthase
VRRAGKALAATCVFYCAAVKPTERLAEATAPDGTVLVLLRHDGAYSIRVDGVELMSTRRTQSELRLAEVACAPLAEKPSTRVLIGGLGFGFTLRESLRLLGADASVVVAELLREVIEWNQHPDYDLADTELRDSRVDLRRDDVANVLRANVAGFDAIMLDIDNGAESLTTGSNRRLYGEKGIRATIDALRPGGVVVYWSADDEPMFVKALTRHGMRVTTERVRSHVTSGGYNHLIIARLPTE